MSKVAMEHLHCAALCELQGEDTKCYAPCMQHIFDPNKSIYQGIRDAKEATCQDSEGSQDPQNQVDALALYENYYIGRVCHI